MSVRGIRGAIDVKTNTKEEIIEATKELIQKIIEENRFEKEEVASIFFSVTKDLDQAFPALSARNLGFVNTAMLCFNEIAVPGSLVMCIRVLMHVNTDQKQNEVKHVYLGGAANLRPDLKD